MRRRAGVLGNFVPTLAPLAAPQPNICREGVPFSDLGRLITKKQKRREIPLTKLATALS
jgi:hypothetical protein